VGWRQRDWARFNDDERRAFFGSGASRGPEPAGKTSRTPRLGSTRGMSPARRRFNEIGAVLLLCLLGAYLVTIVRHRHVGGMSPAKSYVFGEAGIPLKTAAPTRTVSVPPPAKLIAIRWRPTDLAPAANAGRLCVTDPRHGKICASYVVGERPADNLTRRIESLGYHVQSAG
jgi:hypothetical protein